MGLEDDVTNTLTSIKKGIALLDDRRAQLMAGEAADDDQGEPAEDDWQDQPEDEAAPVRS